MVGRARELEQLQRVSDELQRGSSAALVVHGEPGIGKSTILERFVATQTSVQIVSCSGVESEMELPWAALHQVCGSLLDYLPRIPAPQSAALRSAFGLTEDGVPDPFLCGLAVLGLLAEAAEERPVLCVIEDAYALDRVSLTTLAFVSRRLHAESVGLMFSVREIPRELANLPQLRLEGLPATDAGALLDAVVHAPLDPAVRARLIAESHGNPLAIIELASHGHVRRLAGGYDVPAIGRLPARLQESFIGAVRALDSDTQRVLLLAAADPTGDAALLRRAALARGLEVPDASDESVARLIAFSPSVRFRHPLVRSAIYAGATEAERRTAHRALAEAFEHDEAPDRHVWHLAQSLDRPDAAVAETLERAATGAQARGGWAAAAAFLSRAAQITPDPVARARRELAAARARFQTGDAEGAQALLSSAQARDLDQRLRADAELLRAQVESYLTHGADAPAQLLAAARALKPFDPALARETYLEAVQAAVFAAHLATDATPRSIARAALSEAPTIELARPVDLLSDALIRHYAEGAVAPARRALDAILAEVPPSPETQRVLWVATVLAAETLDADAMAALAERAVESARESGMVLRFPVPATSLAAITMMRGNLGAANALLHEAMTVAEHAGAPAPRSALLGLKAWRGEVDSYDELAASVAAEAEHLNQGQILCYIDAATARLRNGLGHYRDALDLCRRMLAVDIPIYGYVIAFEYAEAASRAGTATEIQSAYRYLSTLTEAAHTQWSRGLRALSRALLDDEADPGEAFEESLAEFGQSPLRSYQARVHLLYGEWLRREGRRQVSRRELRIAHDELSRIGCEGFAARAARELALSGEKSRRRTPTMDDALTPQELQVAQMAAAGLSNRQIAERMYLSHRTVGAHLYRVYPKLGITSRNQLHIVLETDPHPENRRT
ncbi:MAG TPA: LuxR C-terminal-related transcriptional regulator [Solirubrobacter sp.]